MTGCALAGQAVTVGGVAFTIGWVGNVPGRLGELVKVIVLVEVMEDFMLRLPSGCGPTGKSFITGDHLLPDRLRPRLKIVIYQNHLECFSLPIGVRRRQVDLVTY